MVLDALLGRKGFQVGVLWRLAGVVLAAGFYLLTQPNAPLRHALYQFDTSIIDLWQRISEPDDPSGKVVVVGIDAASISEIGRWPWGRQDLAELVSAVAEGNPKSVSLDILLSEPGVYSQERLFDVFKQNSAEAHALLQVDPDARLVEALSRIPAAVAVAGAPRGGGGIDPDADNAQCMNPSVINSDAMEPYFVECLLYPQSQFWDVASDAVTAADDDLDGVVRRSYAIVGQRLTDPDTGDQIDLFAAAFPVATLTACAGSDPTCPDLALHPADITTDVDVWAGYRLPWVQREGEPPPPTKLNASFSFWLDFGALPALITHTGEGEAPPHSVVSALDVYNFEPDALARIAGKHVMIGMTRVGDIDRHTTPLTAEVGTPGVVIQALAADNILTGRTIDQPAWIDRAGQAFAGLMILLAILRFGFGSVGVLSVILVVFIAAPIAFSWYAFEYRAEIAFPGLPTIAAILAGLPVFLGRVSSLRRDLADAKEDAIDQASRMGVLHDMQIGSLPFEVDFTEYGVDTASICRPSKEVGGDFFELQRLADGRLFGAVGDVMGKDVHASLVSVISKAIAGSVTNRTDGVLGDAFEEISKEFLRLAPTNWLNDQGGFVTLVATRLDAETGEAEFATAGADTPIVVSKDGEIRDLDIPSVAPFGWLENPTFVTAKLKLNPGDSVIMFTDGVTEAPESTDDKAPPTGNIEFGYERAQTAAKDAAADGAVAILHLLDQRITQHLAGGDPIDDTTILVMTYQGPPSATPANSDQPTET